MEPQPAVLILGGEPWARGEGGTYTQIGGDRSGINEVATLEAAIALYSECLDAIFATRAEYDAAIAVAPVEEIAQ